MAGWIAGQGRDVVVSFSFDGRRRRGIRGLRALEDDAVVVQGGAR